MKVSAVTDYLAEIAPLEMSESWDNTGLLVGNPESEVQRILTCLTLTENVAQEAVSQRVQFIITHHPIPFRPLKHITTDSRAGNILWTLIRSGIAVYSPHTAYDSAPLGINYQLGQRLGLTDITPLYNLKAITAAESEITLGSGRVGVLPEPETLEKFTARIKKVFHMPYIQYVGDPDKNISRAAVGCGAAGEFLIEAQKQNCDVFITGETHYHTYLDAEFSSTALILLGHYTSERFALETLAEYLKKKFPTLEISASKTEHDPVKIIMD